VRRTLLVVQWVGFSLGLMLYLSAYSHLRELGETSRAVISLQQKKLQRSTATADRPSALSDSEEHQLTYALHRLDKVGSVRESGTRMSIAVLIMFGSAAIGSMAQRRFGNGRTPQPP
jgi:hypothetical protein